MERVAVKSRNGTALVTRSPGLNFLGSLALRLSAPEPDGLILTGPLAPRPTCVRDESLELKQAGLGGGIPSCFRGSIFKEALPVSGVGVSFNLAQDSVLASERTESSPGWS